MNIKRILFFSKIILVSKVYFHCDMEIICSIYYDLTFNEIYIYIYIYIYTHIQRK